MKNQKRPTIRYEQFGNMRRVVSVRCEDCERLCDHKDSDFQWHGEVIVNLFVCPNCKSEYWAEDTLVDTSA